MKTASYFLTHLTVAFGVAWALTGSVAMAGLLALVEPLVQTVAYSVHEAAWARSRRERDDPADSPGNGHPACLHAA